MLIIYYLYVCLRFHNSCIVMIVLCISWSNENSVVINCSTLSFLLFPSHRISRKTSTARNKLSLRFSKETGPPPSASIALPPPWEGRHSILLKVYRLYISRSDLSLETLSITYSRPLPLETIFPSMCCKIWLWKFRLAIAFLILLWVFFHNYSFLMFIKTSPIFN